MKITPGNYLDIPDIPVINVNICILFEKNYSLHNICTSFKEKKSSGHDERRHSDYFYLKNKENLKISMNRGRRGNRGITGKNRKHPFTTQVTDWNQTALSRKDYIKIISLKCYKIITFLLLYAD